MFTALTAGLAVTLSLLALAPPPAPTSLVIAAAGDLDAARHLLPGDVIAVAVPSGIVPAGALREASDAAGRVLATPVRRGELLTDRRLVGRTWLAGFGADTVASPVRIADTGILRLLSPGDLVDVLASATDPSTLLEEADASPAAPRSRSPDAARARSRSPSATVVAPAVRVLAIPGGTGSGSDDPVGGDPGEGGLILLATTAEQATELAQAQALARLSLVLRQS